MIYSQFCCLTQVSKGTDPLRLVSASQYVVWTVAKNRLGFYNYFAKKQTAKPIDWMIVNQSIHNTCSCINSTTDTISRVLCKANKKVTWSHKNWSKGTVHLSTRLQPMQTGEHKENEWSRNSPVFSLISQRTLKRAGFILWQFRACFL